MSRDETMKTTQRRDLVSLGRLSADNDIKPRIGNSDSPQQRWTKVQESIWTGLLDRFTLIIVSRTTVITKPCCGNNSDLSGWNLIVSRLFIQNVWSSFPSLRSWVNHCKTVAQHTPSPDHLIQTSTAALHLLIIPFLSSQTCPSTRHLQTSLHHLLQLLFQHVHTCAGCTELRNQNSWYQKFSICHLSLEQMSYYWMALGQKDRQTHNLSGWNRKAVPERHLFNMVFVLYIWRKVLILSPLRKTWSVSMTIADPLKGER